MALHPQRFGVARRDSAEDDASGSASIGRFGYPLGAVVLVVALIPLLAAATLVFVEAGRARTEKRDAEVAAADVTRLILLTDLRISLLEERNWTIASNGLSSLPMNASTVDAVSTIDIEGTLTASITRVDQLVSDLDMPEMAEQLAETRTHPDSYSMFDIGQVYASLEASTADESELVMNRLMTQAGNLEDGGRLISALRVLEATTTARQAISAELTYFYSIQFSGLVPVRETLNGLVIEQAIRDRALTDIERIGSTGSAVEATLADIATSPDVEAYETTTDQLLEYASNPVDSNRALDSFGLASIQESLRITSATTNLYFELVGSAGVDALNASAVLQQSAIRRDQRALRSLVLLIVFTAGLAWFAFRSLLAPIAGLALRARQVRDGHTDTEPARLTGPIEVRQATSAINEAAQQLKLAERQATALAAGDLEHSLLDQPILGELGASLQQAVRTLASSLTEREEFRRRMTYEATHDGLTQLSNRRAALARLDQGLARSQRTGSRLAVLLFDLDWFKEINDYRGHPAGDMVLQIVARRLTSNLRPGDHVGRLGGDEFVVIAEPVGDSEEALQLAKRTRDVLEQPMEIDGASLTISVSIGIALGGESTVGAADLLHGAGLAVGRVKRGGKGGIEFCTDELRQSVAAKVDFEQAIRRAIAEDEFVLHYQPLVDPRSGRCRGVESLIRWDRPAMGMQVPATFIPNAEESDLIVDIDNWVLQAAAEQLVKWEAARINEGLSISVNVSGRHLNSPSFVHEVLRPFRHYGIDPRRLVVEITESSLLDDLPSAAGKLTMLRSQGVKVAIDDFGTGFTSLAHLKSLPMDILKIDRSFTKEDSSLSLVKLIIDIGHLLGVEVVAEGIESSAQADRIITVGADMLQGHHYGRPAPASDSIWLGLPPNQQTPLPVGPVDARARRATSPGHHGE